MNFDEWKLRVVCILTNKGWTVQGLQQVDWQQLKTDFFNQGKTPRQAAQSQTSILFENFRVMKIHKH